MSDIRSHNDEPPPSTVDMRTVVPPPPVVKVPPATVIPATPIRRVVVGMAESQFNTRSFPCQR